MRWESVRQDPARLYERFRANLTPIERSRYDHAREAFEPLSHLIAGRSVLDFGASSGLSMIALLSVGARSVTGVEPDDQRVRQGLAMPTVPHAHLLRVRDTRRLPFADESFDVVSANAVLEHIPQPRDRYIEEIWRCVKQGGHLIVNETPNKWFPKEIHTTGLWWNHYLPKELAYRRAVRHGWKRGRGEWARSGWRGLSYTELVRPLTGYKLIQERTRLRHRILAAFGLPAGILDPYPVWILQKKT